MHFEDLHCFLFRLEGQKYIHLSEFNSLVVPEYAFSQFIMRSSNFPEISSCANKSNSRLLFCQI